MFLLLLQKKTLSVCGCVSYSVQAELQKTQQHKLYSCLHGVPGSKSSEDKFLLFPNDVKEWWR
ncbi:hypothetical protein NC653_038085 [Populus alba x Populus x berolinensis]|uniref:Uncharacterized protein n=1 Tax=Populus alba x Populus x berolinensis TaxID=444605 RepID=A0AAD6PSR5_9ROSI|nr:hypothetical protein NC653_038085 [Populus alba x Populus x berolinensis]